MLLTIDHHSGVPIYRQVVDQIRHLVLAGRIQEGEQLSTVRDLAARLRVNPMTISKAYSLLEMEGLVERQRGIGLFVARVRSQRKAQARDTLIEEALARVVALAVQFGVDKDQVAAMLGDLFEQYDSKKERTP